MIDFMQNHLEKIQLRGANRREVNTESLPNAEYADKIIISTEMDKKKVVISQLDQRVWGQFTIWEGRPRQKITLLKILWYLIAQLFGLKTLIFKKNHFVVGFCLDQTYQLIKIVIPKSNDYSACCLCCLTDGLAMLFEVSIIMNEFKCSIRQMLMVLLISHPLLSILNSDLNKFQPTDYDPLYML